MDRKPAVINVIWLYLILISIAVAAYTGNMAAISTASFDAAKSAVTLALSLIGAMALWLGIMKVAEYAGLTSMIARAIRPVMIRLFPDVPADHPAMGAIIMNMAANMLGLGNAATPLGIKAMTELDKLNQEKGTATNAMCLFLAINTSSVTILPLGVIAVRAAAGATSPAAILIPTFFATCCSTTVAILAAKLLARKTPAVSPVHPNSQPAKHQEPSEISPPYQLSSVSPITKIALAGVLLIFIGAVPYHIFTHGTLPHFSFALVNTATGWLIPMIMGGLLFFGFFRGVRVYEAVTEGAQEGFQVAVRIIPFMVAIFVAIGMFRASGALELFSRLVAPLTTRIGMPPETLPMALLRPLSGTGAYGIMAEIVTRAPDSFASFLASVMQGSTETTFYVLAVYFGAVGIRKTRHALTAALCADAVGLSSALFISHVMFR